MSTNFEHMSDIELAEAETLLRQARERADQKRAESKAAFEPTELGNAKRFTEKFRGEMLFVPDQQQWFYWDERLWTVDVNGHALRQFEVVIRRSTKKSTSRPRKIQPKPPLSPIKPR